MREENLYGREQVAALVAAALSGVITPEQEARLAAWLDSDPANRVFYERLGGRDCLAENRELYGKFDPQRATSNASRMLAARKRGRRRRLAGYAAAILLLAVSVFALREFVRPYDRPVYTVFSTDIAPGRSRARLTIEPRTVLELGVNKYDPNFLIANGIFRDKAGRLTYVNIGELPVRWHTLEVPHGGEYRVSLADGTAITLGPGSALRYPTNFGESERLVELEGEALVETAHRADNQFIIRVGYSEIEAGGTVYIESSPGGDLQAVAVSGMLVANGVQFGAGEYYSVREGRQMTGKTALVQYAEWGGDRFVFDGELIEEVLGRLERWYDIRIYVRNPSLREVRYIGSIPKYEGIETVLGELGAATGVLFELQGRSLLVEK